MAKKKPAAAATLEPNVAPAVLPPAEAARDGCHSRLEAATGSSSALAQDELVTGVLAIRLSKDPAEANKQIGATVALLEGVKAHDELEGMLAVQMVATHQTAMNSLAQAERAQSYELKEMHFRFAEKFLNLYLRQIDALDKHRGKGQSNTSVSHIHVQQGGQSVVGNVQINSAVPPPADRLEIDHNPEKAGSEPPGVKRSRRTNKE